MGWRFEWVSCGAEGKFNHDFGTAFTRDEIGRPGNNYNYGSTRFGGEDAPGGEDPYGDAMGGGLPPEDPKEPRHKFKARRPPARRDPKLYDY